MAFGDPYYPFIVYYTQIGTKILSYWYKSLDHVDCMGSKVILNQLSQWQIQGDKNPSSVTKMIIMTDEFEPPPQLLKLG